MSALRAGSSGAGGCESVSVLFIVLRTTLTAYDGLRMILGWRLWDGGNCIQLVFFSFLDCTASLSFKELDGWRLGRQTFSRFFTIQYATLPSRLTSRQSLRSTTWLDTHTEIGTRRVVSGRRGERVA